MDHGKTTLSDSLVAINGLISERMAGKLRYLDRREDEQQRGITMEAHAVSLVYEDKYLINLIDSPGHVDFSADVSSAVRLCDGGLLVVDVVEGVCVQTCAVARVAWDEGLTMCLVLNKIDRLCMELKLTHDEAHLHLLRIVESVNALLSGFIRKEGQEIDESKLFHPARGNVVFASGTDGWGFRVQDFLPLVSELTKCADLDELTKGLWDVDCGWNGTKVVKITNPANSMFANYILRNLWTVYETAFAEPPKPKLLEKVMSVLKIAPKINLKDKKQTLRSIMHCWLPCGKSLCDLIVDHIPNPAQAQRTNRVDILLPQDNGQDVAEAKDLIRRCDPEAPLIAFVSKMMAVSESEFVALGRVFSGTLRKGMRLRVIGPKHTVDECDGAELQPLLLLGGGMNDFFACDDVPSGNVFACSGLGAHILKTATLTTLDACPSLLRMPKQSAPLLRVSVEPLDPMNWEKLTRGLKLLNKADPVLEVFINPSSGEHLLCAIGELHLDRCLKDLRELFAKVAIKVSPPMASFRETLKSRPNSNNALANVAWRHLTITATPVSQFYKVEDLEQDSLTLPALANANYRLVATNPNGNALLLLGAGEVTDLLDELVSGFHFACRAGPLCEEPLRGVAFVVELTPNLDRTEEASGGAVAAALADAFKRAFKDSGSARLVEAVYKCAFHCLADGEQLGNLYSVILRRRGKIVDEGMVEGTTSLFQIEALIPVVECYGIADELRTKTSGNATSPQLQFSHWEMLPMDPYFTKTSKDDLETEGETVEADKDNNIAYRLMIQVRKRKGLPTGEKVVAVAEKQRTLSRKA